ncbi:hypothetical protein J437_LFUL016850 [Ladona fulva]|uniref:Gamma-interferon-inducible lysosomal thiol reductase n=1 Tax=Ladona fulva TaxID=123851 RepID=A0A8K0P7D3_LADFU|nr:hypothetical protein J437_LFUL016850 [Ladona fulva]
MPIFGRSLQELSYSTETKIFAMYKLASLFLLAMSAYLATAQTPTYVTVYYETLCPDSVKFITKQLFPTWEKMKKYMEVEFVPYGNSNTTENDFVCQHGPDECTGNKLQACALSHLTDQDQKMKFVNCFMGSSNVKSSTECATLINFDARKIEDCANSTEGYDALKKLGDKTKNLSPPLKSVPTVVFNNKPAEADQEKITANFMEALCMRIQGTKPTECGSHSGAEHLLLAPIALVSVFAILLAH